MKLKLCNVIKLIDIFNYIQKLKHDFIQKFQLLKQWRSLEALKVKILKIKLGK